jgi:hypothetical protein
MTLLRAANFRSEKTLADKFGYWAGEIAAHFVRTWVLMLILGAFHHDINRHVPALGYWWTFLLLIGWDSLVSAPIRMNVKRGIEEAW